MYLFILDIILKGGHIIESFYGMQVVSQVKKAELKFNTRFEIYSVFHIRYKNTQCQ